jgi:uncharacterized protein
MPHQCVRCGKIYDDGAAQILTGCECGKRLFFFVKKNSEALMREQSERLTSKERVQIERDIYDMIGEEPSKKGVVVVDIESVKILKPGQYELDLASLFNKKPPIFSTEEGKYVVDLQSAFDMAKEEKNKKNGKTRI